MTRFHIIANNKKDPEGTYTAQIKDTLISLGAEAVTFGGEVPEDTQAILVLGGDGTMLRAAGDTIGRGIPLIGVNLGTLGYLSEVDMNHIKEDLALLFMETPVIEDRMMLCGDIYKQDEDKYQGHCLNEISVAGCKLMSIIRYEVYVNGEFLAEYAADGLVISTPTGSTGYNMSAGGPVVNPKASLIVLTPICPHTLNTRSIVLSPEDRIVVRIPASQTEPVAVLFDGKKAGEISTGEEVCIYRSKQVTRIVKLHTESFLRTLHKKLV